MGFIVRTYETDATLEDDIEYIAGAIERGDIEGDWQALGGYREAAFAYVEAAPGGIEGWRTSYLTLEDGLVHHTSSIDEAKVFTTREEAQAAIDAHACEQDDSFIEEV